MTRADLISLQPPGADERRFALMLLGLGTIVFVALAPFAALKLTPVPLFIPVYQAALFACDLATAWLFLTQYRSLRLPGLLLLGIGYLFTAAAPSLLGAVRDVTGSFDLVLLVFPAAAAL